MILPLLGGSPAVWSTCMVFFQAALLAGYAYAHATTAWLGPARQARLHLAVLALPLAVLPLRVNPGLLRGGEASPIVDVLVLLSTSVGLPFLVVSATAPMLQRWFTQTGHPAARDPYFLYAASNLGSMLALLGYPTIEEPRLALREGWLAQTWLWSAGYVLLAALVVACAVPLWRRAGARPPAEAAADATLSAAAESADLGWARRAYWVALAFVPSSLLLGATAYVTTDIAAIPLLWVLPLALYLLTFIVAFGRWPAGAHRAVLALTPPAVLVWIFLAVSGLRLRLWLLVVMHLVLLLWVALACHGELARDRPPPRHLTEFYLWLSVGGVLGGLFNALVAPVLFSSLAEYPLVMAAALVLLAARRAAPIRAAAGLAVDVALGAAVAVLALLLYSKAVNVSMDVGMLVRGLRLPARVSEWLYPMESTLTKVVRYGPPLAAALLLRRRVPALGLALAGVLLVSTHADWVDEDRVYQARSFFGVLRVSNDDEPRGYVELRHGTTLHGRQSRNPTRRGDPISYYHREGPVGQLFADLQARHLSLRVAVIGLGTGAIAAYARPGDVMTYYEIDRLVRDIAIDQGHFTYVPDARARGATIQVEMGDARVRLDQVRRERPAERYDVILVDAFSSDAIPVHLLTREALRLYLDMLAPGGIVAMHISNRHLRLEPVVARLAWDAALPGRLLQHDEAESEGADRSTWVLLSLSGAALQGLAADPRWKETPLEVEPEVDVWTDDKHDLLSVLKW